MSIDKIIVLDHLQGPLRGSRQVLRRPVDFGGLGIGSKAVTDVGIGVGTGEQAFIHFPAHDVLDVLPRHATLIAAGEDFRIQAASGALVFVNGEKVSEMTLQNGDLIRLGENGPLLQYLELSSDYKTMREVVDDCVECAKDASSSRIMTGIRVLSSLPRDISTKASPVARVMSLGALVLLVGFVGVLTVRLSNLESRVSMQTDDIAQRLGLVETERQITVDELGDLRDEIEATTDRLSDLSFNNRDAADVIRRSLQSVVFIQASYGFANESGEMMRAVVGLDGKPLLDARGNFRATFRGRGPVLDRKYTGTAFVASSDGLLISNHHVAEPWLFDNDARAAVKDGLVPVLIKMVGFLPDSPAPFDVSLVEASSSADVALLHSSQIPAEIPSLQLADTAPQLGQPVLVLGYPAGMRALLARSNPALVDSLLRTSPEPDFWQMALHLADNGNIAPLITRGIIGQISPTAIVYDAETTNGGSGGPVIGLDGRVIAINTAIMGEFGGSNLGVPANKARDLILLHLQQSTGQMP